MGSIPENGWPEALVDRREQAATSTVNTHAIVHARNILRTSTGKIIARNKRRDRSVHPTDRGIGTRAVAIVELFSFV